MAFATSKEKHLTIASVILGILAVVCIIIAAISLVNYYLIRKRGKLAVQYTSNMIDQSQTALKAVTCLKKYYRAYEFFDRNGKNNETTLKMKATIGSHVTTDSKDGITEVCKGMPVDELLSKLEVSDYFKENGSSSSDSDNNNSIIITYDYPNTSTSYSITFPLSDYTFSGDATTVLEIIKQNWLNALTYASEKIECDSSSSSSSSSSS